jgi:glycosyltransferase involved in cell wall biosynthesis
VKVVFASHTYLSSVFVVGSHHLARAAARSDHDVWHLSAAFSVFHLPFAVFNQDYRSRARLALANSRLVEPRLWESVPLTLAPWSLLRWAPRPEAGYLRAFPVLRRAAAELGFIRPDLLLIDEPRMADIIDVVQPGLTIYRPTDVYSHLKRDALLTDVERRLLARVDGIVATSAPVLAHVRSMRRDVPAMVLENGVDYEHCTRAQPEPADLRNIPRPRAIYVGAVDERFNAELLEYAAARNPRVNFIVIGGDMPRIGSRNGARKNVFYLGRRQYGSIPGYLQSSDFAVMPFTAIPANEGRSPMKIFEFGAAGLPVVATATAELQRRKLPFVSLAESAEEFASLCSTVLESGTAEVRELAKRCAAEHDWKAKAQRLFRFTESLVTERRDARPAV